MSASLAGERQEKEGSKLLPYMPDVGDFLFVFTLQLLLFLRPDLLFTDGSTGWHLVAGNYILKTGQIPHTDLFSFTFPDKEWVAYEWLFDVFIAGLVKLGGFNLLAVAVSIVISAIFLMVYDRCRREGCHFGFAAFITIVGILTAAVHFLARPHIITMLGVFLFVAHLEDFYRGTISGIKLVATLALFMVLWVNCHPAYLIGILLCGLYLGVSLIIWLVRRGGESAINYRQRSKYFAFALLAVTGATLVNPYGIKLYEYIFHYLKGSSLLAATNEFMSPVFHGGLHPLCLEILFFFLAAGLYVSKVRLSTPLFLTLMVFAHGSLSAIRNLPLFAVVSVPAIGRLFSSTKLADLRSHHSVPQWLGRIQKGFDKFDVNERQCKKHLLSVGFSLFLIAVALNNGKLFGEQYLTSGFGASNKPVENLEFIRQHDLMSLTGFNYDNWGGYLRYMLDKRVFIDDRADFYGERFYTEYSLVAQMAPGWRDILNGKNMKGLKIDWLLVPKESRTSATLRDDAQWQRVESKDKASDLFLRKGISLPR
ncbi:MAG TPA: hypothetical protein V6D17_13895 [Candidatus Obscuribacterales bacterium]